MTLVLDTSVTLSWYFEHEQTPATDAVLDRVVNLGAVVPTLWRLEVASGFAAAIRRKRIDTNYRNQAIAELGAMPIAADLDTDIYAWTTTLHLADRFGLTPYDAAYLELAQRRKLPLATLDVALRKAAPALGIPLQGRED